MHLHEALFPRTRSAILALCFLNPHERFFLRDIARRLRSGHSTVQKEIQQLTDVGLLRVFRDRNRLYYQANTDSFVFNELWALLERTIGPVGFLNEALRPLQSRIDVAFIYGSIARETATEQSDIDLMVIGRTSFDDIVQATTPYEEDLHREINPSVFPPEEFRAKLRAKNPFLENVMEGPRSFVFGGPDELQALV